MTPQDFLTSILTPGIAWYTALPGWNIPTDDRARLMLLAIPGQESGWSERIQGGPTPAAHGFGQMERNGGVRGVLTHSATWKLATAACVAAGVPSDATHAWGLMATAKGDNLGIAFIRLLLWTDPHSLPALNDEQGAFDCYVRTWRPGAVTAGGDRAVQARDRWHTVYQAALAAIKGQTV